MSGKFEEILTRLIELTQTKFFDGTSHVFVYLLKMARLNQITVTSGLSDLLSCTSFAN